MKLHIFIAVSALTAGLIAYVLISFFTTQISSNSYTIVVGDEVLLPLPSKITKLTVEEAILLRKSIREWRREPITIVQLSMLLWASQGLVEDAGFGWYRRSAPSAGATYPLEVYVVVGNRSVKVDGEFLKAGVYKYDYMRHSIKLVKEGDVRVDLWRASLRQDWVRDAPVTIVLCAVYERTTGRYGERGIRYVHMELGHVGQNIYLVATALDLGTVAIGAFYDEEVAKIISSARNERPLYLFPVGVPEEPHKTTFEELGKLYERLRGSS
ncbi:MAG: SagB/ThcOx family dehydrogenase [Sulfolobales archaeon]|nr:SagB/ThcOx family dehydrogenase [Sulfolobales archaeon]MDW8082472.1 SagB/ThcOx family dehydrogenase [Sulfolobales archaeon]